jgi:hypothetical protein
MQMRRIASRVALISSSLVLVVQVSAGGPDGRGNHHGRVEVTFTKWVLNGGAGPFMAGATGGEIEGAFLGEVFENVPSKRVPSLVNRLEVIYQVQAEDPDLSFIALLQGGSSQGKALLDGFIVNGWRRGADVHVAWTAKPQVNCPPAPAGAGANCFVGTMTIERLHDDDE